MNIIQIARKVSKSPAALGIGIVALSFVLSEAAYAGTGGSEFEGIWDTLEAWVEGTLGRIIAGAFVLVGIIGGIARQSIMAFAIGVGSGMGLANSPAIIEAIVTATLEKAATVTPTIVQFSNGLGS